MSGIPYNIFKRGKFFYARFKDQKGNFLTAHSTKQTTKASAINWVINHLKENKIFTSRDRVTFAEYAKDFFYDNGIYATNKRNSGKRLGNHHLQERRDIMRNHILPFLSDILIQDIKYKNMEEFRNKMFSQGYAGSFIKKNLQTINAILKEACKEEIINAIPILPECSTIVINPRGCLTVDEVRALFTIGKWSDQRAFTASLLSASTGLRLGEVQGLVMSDLHSAEGLLHCRRSFDNRNRVLNSTTKTGRSRNIILSTKVIEALQEMIFSNPFAPLSDESPLFWGDNPENPTFRNILISGLCGQLLPIFRELLCRLPLRKDYATRFKIICSGGLDEKNISISNFCNYCCFHSYLRHKNVYRQSTHGKTINPFIKSS